MVKLQFWSYATQLSFIYHYSQAHSSLEWQYLLRSYLWIYLEIIRIQYSSHLFFCLEIRIQ